ncbi:MAG: dephospho-CoA kinase [Micropepsaceae bacterium]
MLLVGLTGSIGMGKSETARMFRALGVPVYDADAAVHALYDTGGAAVEAIGAAFPGSVKDGKVDRAVLGPMTLGDAAAIRKLESIIHPLVGKAQMDFLHDAESKGAALVVLDIPLLFETGGEMRVDAVIVVSAPADVQRARVLARPGMTEEKFEQILKRQTADAVKRAKAHYVIDTHLGLDHARERVAYVLEDLKRREAKIWSARKASSQT